MNKSDGKTLNGGFVKTENGYLTCDTCGSFVGDAQLVHADYNGWDVFYKRGTGFFARSLDGDYRHIGMGAELDAFFRDFSA